MEGEPQLGAMDSFTEVRKRTQADLLKNALLLSKGYKADPMDIYGSLLNPEDPDNERWVKALADIGENNLETNADRFESIDKLSIALQEMEGVERILATIRLCDDPELACDLYRSAKSLMNNARMFAEQSRTTATIESSNWERILSELGKTYPSIRLATYDPERLDGAISSLENELSEFDGRNKVVQWFAKKKRIEMESELEAAQYVRGVRDEVLEISELKSKIDAISGSTNDETGKNEIGQAFRSFIDKYKIEVEKTSVHRENLIKNEKFEEEVKGAVQEGIKVSISRRVDYSMERNKDYPAYKDYEKSKEAEESRRLVVKSKTEEIYQLVMKYYQSKEPTDKEVVVQALIQNQYDRKDIERMIESHDPSIIMEKSFSSGVGLLLGQKDYSQLEKMAELAIKNGLYNIYSEIKNLVRDIKYGGTITEEWKEPSDDKLAITLAGILKSDQFANEIGRDFADVAMSNIISHYSEILFKGGYESWAGTAVASSVFPYLKNPQVISEMLRHQVKQPGGHTSNAVNESLMEIIYSLSNDEATEYSSQLNPVAAKLFWFCREAHNFYLKNDDGRHIPLDGYGRSQIISKEGSAHILEIYSMSLGDPDKYSGWLSAVMKNIDEIDGADNEFWTKVGQLIKVGKFQNEDLLEMANNIARRSGEKEVLDLLPIVLDKISDQSRALLLSTIAQRIADLNKSIRQKQYSESYAEYIAKNREVILTSVQSWLTNFKDVKNDEDYSGYLRLMEEFDATDSPYVKQVAKSALENSREEYFMAQGALTLIKIAGKQDGVLEVGFSEMAGKIFAGNSGNKGKSYFETRMDDDIENISALYDFEKNPHLLRLAAMTYSKLSLSARFDSREGSVSIAERYRAAIVAKTVESKDYIAAFYVLIDHWNEDAPDKIDGAYFTTEIVKHWDELPEEYSILNLIKRFSTIFNSEQVGIVAEALMAKMESNQNPHFFWDAIFALNRNLNLDSFTVPDKLLASRNTSESIIEKMQLLYRKKDLASGIKMREDYLNALNDLTIDPEGMEMLTKILEPVKGSKDDPSRVRNVFRLLKNVKRLEGVPVIEGEDLREMANGLKQQVANLVITKFELSPELKEVILANEELLDTKGFEMLSDLLACYSARGSAVHGATTDLKELVTDYVQGRFEERRYNLALEENGPVTSFLPEDKKVEIWDSWRNNVSLDKEQIVELLGGGKVYEKNAKGIMAEIDDVLLTHLPDVVRLNGNQLRASDSMISLIEIDNMLEKQIRGDADNREAEGAKSVVSSLARLLNSLNTIKEMNGAVIHNSILAMKTIKEIKGLISGIKNKTISYEMGENKITIETGDFQEVIRDLEAMELMLDTEGRISTERLSVSEKDDLVTMLNIGNEPVGSCQATKGGGYNEGLMAVRNGTRKTVWIFDGSESKARANIRLMNVKMPTGKELPAIVQERDYIGGIGREAAVLMAALLLQKSAEQRLAVVLSDENSALHLSDMIERLGYTLLPQQKVNVFLPCSKGMYDYSDIMGGVIRKDSTNLWKDIKGVVLVPSEILGA